MAMIVHVRTAGVRLFLPIPMGLGVLLLRHAPCAVLEQMQQHVPTPYDALVTRESLCLILDAVQEVAAECRGLEIVHVETADGTFVSIRL